MGKHLVIVGAGHAHLTVLKNLKEFKNRGHDVTVVSASPLHYYSGMGPGLLSGIYRPAEVRFHVKKMAEDRGASFLEDRVVKVEPARRTLLLTIERFQQSVQALLEIPSPTGYTDNVARYVCGELERIGIEYDLTRRGAAVTLFDASRVARPSIAPLKLLAQEFKGDLAFDPYSTPSSEAATSSQRISPTAPNCPPWPSFLPKTKSPVVVLTCPPPNWAT